MSPSLRTNTNFSVGISLLAGLTQAAGAEAVVANRRAARSWSRGVVPFLWRLLCSLLGETGVAATARPLWRKKSAVFLALALAFVALLPFNAAQRAKSGTIAHGSSIFSASVLMAAAKAPLIR